MLRATASVPISVFAPMAMPGTAMKQGGDADHDRPRAAARANASRRGGCSYSIEVGPCAALDRVAERDQGGIGALVWGGHEVAS
jgi:hypothetical protein